ncbi:peptidylprolyl isomerase [Phycisphaera mikurensis]|uniref:peptidylprolyl isomerase n=1 Tax=Phycisphaera mikurensis (strain NBRC 102666 / KCTC 22515 / FYK2301M01) TaxID=1142394 RepID=I0IBL4_PHYMF|nr:peptidylprolyl isomerase [Phycisphaera mikurensis]MBB6442819.1 peptidyl-prolyl cis-trans isomerase A (cyclophilin A) [Phycisphaera mikurensis]BAM02652.1 peptidyl-prolyl cis-trans isomerase [Phycisphaera mikurensis NBRC 102666]
MPLARLTAAAPALAALLAAASPAAAETVRFDTVFGSFDVDLFDEATPGHVANFLGYVDAGEYDGTIFHRAAEDDQGREFVVQGGAFRYDGEPVSTPFDLGSVPNRGPVANEPGISNTRGTLALARVGGQEDSGTNQFFFNLKDNGFLDGVDGGFTVFGEVADDTGLSILDQIAGVPTFRGGAPFGELPLRDFAFEDGVTPELGPDEFVLIHSVARVAVDGDGNDAVDDGGVDVPVDGGGGGGGGVPDPVAVPTPAAAVTGLLGLAVCALRRPLRGDAAADAG